MTTFSKILALFTTAACFAFLGFVTVSLVAGPNWQGETNDYPNYVFEYTGGEAPTWAAKRRDNDQAVGGANKVLPKKIVEVLTQIEKEQKDRIALLDNGNPDPQNRVLGIGDLDALIHDPNQGIEVMLYKDIAALNRQEQKLQADIAKQRDALETTSREVTDQVTAIEAIYIEAERRRGDIYRLQNLAAEARTDEYRADEHQKKLRDVWERYQGVIAQLKQRNEILRKQLAEKQRLQYEASPAGN
jgi:DNA repair exonuclease SbcCD ATPase subunit